MEQTTKTKDTKKSYIERAILLQRKALKDITRLFEKPPASDLVLAKIGGKSFETLNIKDTADFACAFWAKTLYKSTWRYYRSSLIYYAEVMHENNSLSAADLSHIVRELRTTDASSFKYNRTSSQKKKYLNDHELEQITLALQDSRSKYAKTLRGWLHVNCIVGLRPCEWRGTEIVKYKGRVSLMVKNAKQTNGRSHGKTRAIPLDHLPEGIIKLIVGFSRHMNKISDEGRYDEVYQGCRRLLQDLNNRLWKRRKKNITLYSSRHQFSADMKKSGASLTDLAYLMGHYSTDTVTSHYGKRRYGKSIVRPQVDQELTTGIQRKFKPFKLGSKPNSPSPKNPTLG
ncbi:hypothetical protein OTK49_21685 [Vibrio coralliirubri]|uniref:hypothetical protein n=1 Tax=Vibrio coralliirubri TaxID=1516159 RepID=UPI002283C914|nr:hypothetical protein [Vibrio coralliirubri]MCY9865135.1 hypothetical protein [Vibrio coralliirubri]